MGQAFLFVRVHSSANLVRLASPQKGIVGMFSEIIIRQQDDPITFWHRLTIKRTQSSVSDSNTEIAADTQCTVIRKELPRVRRPSLQREDELVGARSRNGFPFYTLKLTSFTDSHCNHLASGTWSTELKLTRFVPPLSHLPDAQL